jgi:CCR4-NOT transcriptional complex subunit CAF120
MSQFSKHSNDKGSAPASPTLATSPTERFPTTQGTLPLDHSLADYTPPQPQQPWMASEPMSRESPQGRQRATSRPVSMISTYQPPLMEVTEDTLPELQPIFTFLNSHANKLYQEGYFLKLDDQNSRT